MGRVIPDVLMNAVAGSIRTLISGTPPVPFWASLFVIFPVLVFLGAEAKVYARACPHRDELA